jgi:hypothetical protein
VEEQKPLARLADYEQDKADLRIAADAAALDDLTQAAAWRRTLGQRIDSEVLSGAPAESQQGAEEVGAIRIRSPETHNYFPPKATGISPIVSALVTAALLAGGGLAGAAITALLSRAPAVLTPAAPPHVEKGILIELLD